MLVAAVASCFDHYVPLARRPFKISVQGLGVEIEGTAPKTDVGSALREHPIRPNLKVQAIRHGHAAAAEGAVAQSRHRFPQKLFYVEVSYEHDSGRKSNHP